MRVLVIGSRGRTARKVVRLLLDRGHEVTAFADPSDTLRAANSRLHVVRGDASDARSIERAVKNQDAVISFIAANPVEAQNILGPTLAAAMTKLGVKRLVNLVA